MNPADNARRAVAEQAALWLLTLQGDELSAAQRAEFIDWLRESPQHISELLRASRLQRTLVKFKGWSQIAALADAHSAKTVLLLEAATAYAPHRPARHGLRQWLLIAASVLIVGGLGVWALTRFDQTVLTTQLGERREISLIDGSVVDLAPGSEVVVRYRTHERRIALNHGEALFHVAKNPQRPFVVQAALTSVRAVGTVFNVERGEQGVSVTVVEGRVAVSQQSAPLSFADRAASTPLMLSADDQVQISPAGRATAVHKVRSSAELGWANGQLVFDDEPIGEIAHRFNLYNRTQIRVTDPELAARRVSGVFRASDPESFVAFVQSVADAKVTQRDAEAITLIPAPKAEGAAAK